MQPRKESAREGFLPKSEWRRAMSGPLLYNRSSDAMQPAGPTLKKIFADTLRREAGEDAPLLAWALACGAKVAARTNAISYANGVLTVEVPDAIWQHQLQGLHTQYLAALKPISSQPVNSIKFVVKGRAERPPR
jgi:Dna[CI] antecedent DciA-like protein